MPLRICANTNPSLLQNIEMIGGIAGFEEEHPLAMGFPDCNGFDLIDKTLSHAFE
jgi:hypothetical protein